MIAHKLALNNKDLRDYFSDSLFDEEVGGKEFELLQIREFSNIALTKFDLS